MGIHFSRPLPTHTIARTRRLISKLDRLVDHDPILSFCREVLMHRVRHETFTEEIWGVRAYKRRGKEGGRMGVMVCRGGMLRACRGRAVRASRGSSGDGRRARGTRRGAC